MPHQGNVFTTFCRGDTLCYFLHCNLTFRYSLYSKAIWPVLPCDIVHIAMQKSLFRLVKVYMLASTCQSIGYEILQGGFLGLKILSKRGRTMNAVSGEWENNTEEMPTREREHLWIWLSFVDIYHRTGKSSRNVKWKRSRIPSPCKANAAWLYMGQLFLHLYGHADILFGAVVA